MNKPHSWYFRGARLHVLFVVLLLVGIATSIWYAGIGQAQGPPEAIVVNSLEDVKQNDGDCTLREAIIAANSDKKSGSRPGECPAGNSGFDTIILRAEPDPITGLAKYALLRTDNGNEDAASTGDLDILSDINVIGAGSGETIIDASGISDRAFQILSGSVNISGVTITRNDTTFSGEGGAIYNDGYLTLTNSVVVDSGATGLGGGIYNNTGSLTINNSAISGNMGGAGGGIANASAGSLVLNNSTISGNDAPIGGGIFNAGILELHNVTVTGNSSGVNNADASGTVIVRNTIIADNDNDADVSGPSFTSQGYNLIGAAPSGSGFENGVNGDQVGIDPMLDSVLKDNGGQTLTHALLPESPAIDAGDPKGCFGSVGFLSMDQRGEPRPMDGDFDRQFRCDVGAFEVGGTGLVIIRAKPDGTIDGRLSSAPDTTFTLEFFSAQVCPAEVGPVDGAIYLLPVPDPSQTILAKTDAFGNVYFSATVMPPEDGTFVYGRATSLGGTAPEYSKCVPVGPGNTSWPNALSLDEKTSYPPIATYDQFIDKQGQSRWYRFSVQPDSQVIVTLTGVNEVSLPANYDLTIYKDIAATFRDLATPANNSELVRLNAEFAGDAFSGDAFSGDAFSGDAFSGDAFSGDAFSGDAFSGDAFSGDAFSGDAFSGDAFSGDAFSGDAFSADVYTGDAFSGDAFSGDAFSGDAFSGDAFSGDAFSSDAYNAIFSSAQTRSLLGVSAFEGTASEGIRVNTWNNTGEFYVRVRGRNGAFNLDAPFRLRVEIKYGSCGQISPLPDTSATPVIIGGKNPTTLILTDMERSRDHIEGTETEKTDLWKELEDLGTVVDVNQDPRVNFANNQADDNPTCPYAKNLIVEAIRDIVTAYREQNPNLEYVVIVGGDEIIPFARVPDDSLLANEENYFPPVLDNTASQASLRLGYVLTQDVYVSQDDISFKNSTLPVPGEVSIGRLVETAPEMIAVIDAYNKAGGVVAPQSALATGYDFLEDVAAEIRKQLREGIDEGPAPSCNEDPGCLIVSGGPSNPDAWTAEDLRNQLLPESGIGPDIAFLAGHFTGNSALAADYTTRLLASEVADASVDLSGSVIFIVGCHAGYNIVNQHDVPNKTREPDWAQAFAGQGATLISGTGYQYGDTDLLKYSEELYLEFSRQLRRASSSDPVSIGQALARAKKAYLVRTPVVSGLDEKALLEATIFGLPMLKVDLNRNYVPDVPSEVTIDLQDFDPNPPNPAAVLELKYADISVKPTMQEGQEPFLKEHFRQLRDVETGEVLLSVQGSYLEGFNGYEADPGEPILPLEVRDVSVDNTVLRGVGFRGGTYTEEDVIPLISSATTEVSGVAMPFLTDNFHPVQPWRVNYFDALGGGKTYLMAMHAQHRSSPNLSDPQKSTRRQFSEMNFRLYYSNNKDTFYGDPDHPSTPASSAPPSIISVSDVLSGTEVTFNATVVGNPSAGIQEVWVTHTVCDPNDYPRNGMWQSINLVQSTADSTQWSATRTLTDLGVNDLTVDNVCFMVQAVNGVGLVSRADNLGLFFRVDLDIKPTLATKLEFQPPAPSSGPFGTKVSFSAKLSQTHDENGDSLPNPQALSEQIVSFDLGSQTRRAPTDANGVAEIELALIGAAGDYEIGVSFPGAGLYKPSNDTISPFTIERQSTRIVLEPDPVRALSTDDKIITATLTTVDIEPDPDVSKFRPLGEKTLVFEVSGSEGSYSEAIITDPGGRAFLGNIPLPDGTYDVSVSFVGTSNYEPKSANVEMELLTVCSTATAMIQPDNPPSIWPPNGDPVTVDVLIDSTATISITGIFQDEPVEGDPSAEIVDFDTVQVPAKRAGDSNGRVYHILFTATDELGVSCQGDARVPVVSHDQSGDIDMFDEGPLYDSTVSSKFAPVASDDINSTTEDGVATGNVLENDTDQNPQDILSVTAVNADSGALGSQVALASGALLTVQSTGDYEYDPNSQFESLAAGQSVTDTFEYTVNDGDGGTDIGLVTITINGLNDAPLAVDDGPFATLQNTDVAVVVLDNDTDVDGVSLNVSNFDANSVQGGNVSLNLDSSFTYTPPLDFLGQDSFTYQVSDGELMSNIATVTIVVNALDDPPTANPDGPFTTDEDTPLNGVDVLANDTDDGSIDSTTVTIASGPNNGTASVDPDSGQVTYTPHQDFNGADSFTYTVDDDAGQTSNEATVTINVQPVNDTPVANDDAVATSENTSVTIDVLGNDQDVDGDSLTITSFDAASTQGGSVDCSSDQCIYTPPTDFNGTDGFTYEVGDGMGGTDTAAVTVTVNPGNDPPQAFDDSRDALPRGEPAKICVLDNDTDLNLDPLTVVDFSLPERGSVVVATDDNLDPNCVKDQVLIYTPSSNFRGSDTFTYTISDGRGGTDTATVTLVFGRPGG